MTRHALAFGALAALLASCTPSRVNRWGEENGEEGGATAQSSQPVAPAPPRPFDAKAFAAQYTNAIMCEAAARELIPTSPRNAWAALVACTQQVKFTLIREVTSDAWLPVLLKDPNALSFLARMVAVRGGPIDRDVKLLNDRKVPIFRLPAVMAQPALYKGKHVLMRAAVAEIGMQGETQTVKMAELQLGSTGQEVAVGPAYKSTSSSTSSRTGSYGGSAQARVSTSNYGKASARGSYEGNSRSSSSSSSEYTTQKVEQRFENVSNPTGREVLGKLETADPFLEVNKELVVLARFEGVKTTAGGEADDEPQTIAVLTILKYFVPDATVAF